MAKANVTLAVLLGGSVCLGVASWTGLGGGRGLALGVGAGLGVAGAWLREYRRTVAFLRRSPMQVLLGDGMYLAAACAGVAIGTKVAGRVCAEGILGAVGVAGIVTGLRWRGRRPKGEFAQTATQEVRQTLAQVRWTLPSVGVSWLQGNSYVYILAAFGGSALVANYAAARLVVSPLALLAVGWGRVFQPAAGGKLAKGDEIGVMRLALKGVVGLLIIGCVYGGILWWALNSDLGTRIPAHYRGLGGTVLLWWLYLMVTAARGVSTLTLMAALAFRDLFVAAFITTCLSMLFMFGASALHQTNLVIVAMIVTESGLCAWQWYRAHRRLLSARVEREASAAMAWPATGP